MFFLVHGRAVLPLIGEWCGGFASQSFSVIRGSRAITMNPNLAEAHNELARVYWFRAVVDNLEEQWWSSSLVAGRLEHQPRPEIRARAVASLSHLEG